MCFRRRTPRGWGSDALSKDIASAHSNVLASYSHRPEQYALASDVDRCFRTVIRHAPELSKTEHWFAPLLLPEAHGAFAAAAATALSGQLSVSFALQRATLERAVYGYHLAADADLQEMWIRRGESSAHTKLIREHFKWGALLQQVKQVDSVIGAKVGELYDQTIDFGAHPNVQGCLQALKEIREGSVRRFDAVYFVNSFPFFENCLKSCVEVGIVALRVFALLWADLFQEWAVTSELNRIEGLCCGPEET